MAPFHIHYDYEPQMTYEGDIGFLETFYNVYACLRYQKPVESCINTAFVGNSNL